MVSDEVACGEMAADFFIEGGWKNVGYVGPPPTLAYSNQLFEALERRLKGSQIELHKYEQQTSTRLVTVRISRLALVIG